MATDEVDIPVEATAATSIVTTDATEIVLREEEAARATAFGRASALVGAIGLAIIAAPFMVLTTAERIRIAIPVAALTLTGAGMWLNGRRSLLYTPTIGRVLSFISVVSTLAVVYLLGVFTPIVVVVVLGLAIDVRDRMLAKWSARFMVVSYVVVACLVTVGVLPDNGLWRQNGLDVYISITVVVTAILIMQSRFARASRVSLEQAVARAREMALVARTREAQLDEAREILDVAFRRGIQGRLTGRTLDGYRVGEIVGRGAMGEVYSAEQIESGSAQRRVAIKVLRASDDDAIAERFFREAHIALKVRGPNLVDVYRTGRTEDGDLFIVMELLVGSDLAAILRGEDALALGDVVTLVEEVARGLDVLHAAGVIHRDLKPQNLFLAESDGGKSRWKILDYGVSKIAGAGTMTHGDIIGTPAYMAPEQAEGGKVDARSDVFALAAVAYRALTGRRPFSGSDVPSILYQVVHGTPGRMTAIDPSIPREVEAVITSALAKRPADRYATASELASALRRASQAEAPTDTEETTTVSV